MFIKTSGKDFRTILATIQKDTQNPIWLKCPTCGKQWNKLTPSGSCIDCVESLE